ncbi:MULTISPECIES: hypothetical protein [unclassified Streptomyces]|uniref:hypothetical protein n=1 Tax=unclassified Streptomyces TaxID=2593676 RepID=UPI00332DF0CA
MPRNRTRLAAAGLALVGAATMTGVAAGTAHAGASGFYVSLQPNSNIRTGPFVAAGVVANTGPTVDRFYMDGVCYLEGDRVTAGGYTTDIWYRGTVFDSASPATYRTAWVWGGNVNVGKDPADSVEWC